MSTPAELYRNAIDLNRYSNSVAKRIIVSYNDLLVDTAQRLAGLDAVSAPAKAARLRATLGQLKTSLDEWASNSTALSVRELEELAGVQAGFVEEQLREAIPLEFRNQVRSVEISPRFAEAVATADPTQQGIVSLSDDLEAAVKGAKDVVRVTVADGVTMTLPNGQVLKNSFANMAQKEAAFFGQAVRNGFLTGEPTDSIIRRLKGRLTEGDAGPISQILRAGGESTVRANNQIRTLVRTSVNQVANAASMKTYEANQDITTKYRYTATLDSRTSPVCRALDGTEHLYGKGPIPPQHFNCRSTTVPIVDYEGLGFDPPPPSKLGRPNGDKNIPDGENYGPWLKRQPKAVQEKVLGDQGQVGYFNALSRKYGPDGAIRRFVREDGSEKTIGDLKEAYGDPSKIKAKPKAKPKPKVAPKTAIPKQTDRDYIQAHQFDNGKNKLSHQDIADSLEAAGEEPGLVGEHMRQMMAFVRKKEIQTIWSNGREKVVGPDFNHWADTDIIKALRAGKGKGEGVVKDVADALEKGQKSPFLHTIGRVSSGAGGHTIQAAHIVVMKQESQYVKLAKSGIEKIRVAIRNSVTQSAAGRPMQVATKDLYKKTGKTTWKTTEGWLGTYVHEMGHQIHFRAGMPSIDKLIAEKTKGLTGEKLLVERNKLGWNPSKYGTTNGMERFAETFVQFVFAPDELKKASPVAYKWVEEAMKEALK